MIPEQIRLRLTHSFPIHLFSILWKQKLYVFLTENLSDYTAQKMKFPINDLFSKCDQIRRKPRIWSHLLKVSLMENFIFCGVEQFNY